MQNDFKGAIYHVKEADENFKGAIFHVRNIDGGGGGSVDYTKVVSKTNSMPVAGADNANMIYLYDGVTGADYTHGCIYENVKTATYTSTVSFEPATLSGTTVTCSGDDFATFLTEAGADPTPIVNGTMTYDAGAGGWRLVGKDAEDTTITSFLEYDEDYTDAGFTFTGTPQDGDVIAFTCAVEEASASYAWTRIDVQPQPTAQDIGATVKTDRTATLTAADWSNKVQTVSVVGVTAANTIFVAPAPASTADYAEAGIVCKAQAAGTLTFECTTTPSNAITVNVAIFD